MTDLEQAAKEVRELRVAKREAEARLKAAKEEFGCAQRVLDSVAIKESRAIWKLEQIATGEAFDG